jgi:lipid-binding SYLF domain-containing protein
MGADSTDIILLVMNQKGLEKLLADRFSIGADVAAVAGPVGRNAKADTDVFLQAEILGWSRSKGMFAGASFNGTVVENDKAETRKLYGRAWTNREIIRGGIAMPDAAKAFAAELERDIYKK